MTISRNKTVRSEGVCLSQTSLKTQSHNALWFRISSFVEYCIRDINQLDTNSVHATTIRFATHADHPLQLQYTALDQCLREASLSLWRTLADLAASTIRDVYRVG